MVVDFFSILHGSRVCGLLLLRMVLLMMVAVCLNATLVLEQPYSSYFEFYPRWREFVCMLQKHGGQTADSLMQINTVEVYTGPLVYDVGYGYSKGILCVQTISP